VPRPAPAAPALGDPGRQLLEVLLNRPDLFGNVAEKVGPDDFPQPPLRTVARALWELAEADRLSLADLLGREDLAGESALLVELAEEGARRGNYEPTLAGAVEALAHRRQQGPGDEADDEDEMLRRIQHRARQPDPRKRPRIC